MVGLVPLQTSVVAVAGTFAAFAVFLSVTAHIAARNVLGDVPVRNAVAVGPLPAGVAFVFTALSWPPALAVVVAVVADAAVIGFMYERDAKLTAYITLIHAVVSVILGVIVFGLWTLARSAPA
jgi:hypothetical protein